LSHSRGRADNVALAVTKMRIVELELALRGVLCRLGLAQWQSRHCAFRARSPRAQVGRETPRRPLEAAGDSAARAVRIRAQRPRYSGAVARCLENEKANAPDPLGGIACRALLAAHVGGASAAVRLMSPRCAKNCAAHRPSA